MLTVYLESLPDEILLHLCEYLSPRDLLSLRQSSNKFKHICNRNLFKAKTTQIPELGQLYLKVTKKDPRLDRNAAVKQMASKIRLILGRKPKEITKSKVRKHQTTIQERKRIGLDQSQPVSKAYYNYWVKQCLLKRQIACLFAFSGCGLFPFTEREILFVEENDLFVIDDHTFLVAEQLHLPERCEQKPELVWVNNNWI